MGRHSTSPDRKEGPKRAQLRSAARRVWHVLPETWRGWLWVRRQQWRGWQDRRHTPAGEWDASLPKDAGFWSDDWNFGSYGVGAKLRSHRRKRGDLLPDHHTDQETS